jgi:hypothetical protein
MNNLLNMLRVVSSGPTYSRDSAQSKRVIISRLKFIGTIMPHEKIDVKNLRIESPSIFTPIRRIFFNESRDTTLYFFTSTIDRSFEIIDAYLNSKKTSDKLFCANLITDLMNSVKGLQSIQTTYVDDKLVCCEISQMIETIQSKIYEIQESFPELLIMKELCVLQVKKESETQAETLNTEMSDGI